MTAAPARVGAGSSPERARRPRWRRLAGPLLSVVLVAAVFFWFLPQFTSLSDVWTSVKAMSWTEVGVLLLAAVWNLATYQFVVVSTMPGLPSGRPPSRPRRRQPCPTPWSAVRRSLSA
ncbi:hypothetical protein [Blastococcus mobilis]|uniref:Uncharacterized protein n=1 Tax=Blastococcus mobilis TaxID=1938746 RepID=A0A238Y136_9ACTN|nr:hypothetical protein [Blastococcus mobilis]SNR64935.1 hypothetical protein SAMN06272737_11730 [Blastococcus mobilis]